MNKADNGDTKVTSRNVSKINTVSYVKKRPGFYFSTKNELIKRKIIVKVYEHWELPVIS